MFKKPGKISFYMSRIQTRATYLTILFAALGVYVNAFFNYTNMMMNRSRYAIEQIKYISDSYINPEQTYGKSCIVYVTQNFDDGELEEIWAESSESFLLHKLDAHKDGDLLRKCLSAYKIFDTRIDFEKFIAERVDQHDLALISYKISRQVFSFLNTHETVFRTWKENKSDQYILCEQLKNKSIEDELLKFTSKSMAALQSKRHDLSLIQVSYPNTLWYLEGKNICDQKLKLWYKNFIDPIIP